MKPTIFFSHSGRDGAALARLKTLFIDKTGGSIAVFLSSDGQSIPLGKNWVHRVEEELKSAALMLVFVTPNALSSSWIYFEAGFAYSKGIRVIPVGFLGVDLATVPAPLNLLQGFNVTSEDGLNNIIAVVNSEFSCSHKLTIDADDYRWVTGSSQGELGSSLESFSAMVDHVQIHVKSEELACLGAKLFARIEQFLEVEGVEFIRNESTFVMHGSSLTLTDAGDAIDIQAGLLLSRLTLPLLERLLRAVRTGGLRHSTMELELSAPFIIKPVYMDNSAKLHGTAIKLLPNYEFGFECLAFWFLYAHRPGMATRVALRSAEEALPMAALQKLLTLLVERKVIMRITEE